MKVLLADIHQDRPSLGLAIALKQMGVSLMVITGPETRALKLCRENNIDFVEFDFRHRFQWSAMDLFRELQSRFNPDIIHCFTSRALSTALIGLRKVHPRPRIIAYRGTSGHLSRFDPASRFAYLHPRVDAIICVSGSVRSYLKKFSIPDERLEVIWKGHGTGWYQSAPREALKEFGLPPEAVVVNFTGNIRPVKGIHYLVEAFRTISPEEGIHLLVVGQVRDRRVMKAARGLSHVHWAGYREDASALAGACDISIMTSIDREGLPRATIEAMAQGVCPVVTSVGGLTELVVDGVSGLVIPPKKSDAISHAIRALSRDSALRKRLGAAARERIEGPFNFKQTVEKTYALYDRLLV